MGNVKHTPGPWEYVPSNEHHGPYVANGWGAGDICDCYTMTLPNQPSTASGGPSRPIHFQHGEAEANARLIASAPDLLEALRMAKVWLDFDGRFDMQGINAAIAKAEGN